MGLFSFAIPFFATFFGGVCLSDNIIVKNRKVTVSSDKVKKDCRFVFITDIHGKFFPDKPFGNNYDGLVKLIKKQNPDFVIIGGDAITAKYDIKIKQGIELARALSKEFKVYYGIGNHEAKLDWEKNMAVPISLKEYERMVKQSGATVLDNVSAKLDEYNVELLGLNLPEEYYDKKHERKLEVYRILEKLDVEDDGAFNILLAHNPEYAYAYRKLPTDMILSGHMHGGLLRLPGGRGFITPRFKLGKEKCWGVYRYGKITHVISQGLANHTLPVRIFNPGEIVTVNVKKK
jgi:hypothetical protein